MRDLADSVKEAADHASRLVLYARQWCDGETARDVVQEALVRLVERGEGPEELVAWMYATVRNGAISAARSGWRRKRREEKVARREWFETGAESMLDALAAQKAVEGLARELREAVVLRIWGELSFPQMARVMEVSVGTAHQRYGEAMELLREKLRVEKSDARKQ